jgi:subtilisin family serine protease
MLRRMNGFRHPLAIATLLFAALNPLTAGAQLRVPIGPAAPGAGDIAPRLPEPPDRTPSAASTTAGSVSSPAAQPAAVEGLTGTTGSIRNTVTNTLSGPVQNGVVGPAVRARELTRDPVGRAANPSVANRSPSRRIAIPPASEGRYRPDEVVVSLPSNLSPQAVDAIARRHGLMRLDSQATALTGTTFHRWRINDGRSVTAVLRRLQAEGAIAAAQPNYRFRLQQSDVATRAARAHQAQYMIAKLRLPEAHSLTTGANVLVAVIDSAIDTTHPEIAGAVAGSYDAVKSAEPPHAHGTAIAGAIGAHARLTGVAPSARILAIRAFWGDGPEAESTTVTILKGLDWAVAHGARVINMSFAGPQDPEIARALAAASKKGIVLIAAAGNAGPKSPPLYPAADPNVIAVAATDSEDKLFAESSGGKHVAIAAPGVDILTPAPDGRYQVSSGTSFAAAHVSGVVALLLALRPDLKPAAVRGILLSTAKDLGPKGRDDQFGAGLANAYRAAVAVDADVAHLARSNASTAR